MPSNSAEFLNIIFALTIETRKLGPVLSPESPEHVPLASLEPGPVVSPKPQAPFLPSVKVYCRTICLISHFCKSVCTFVKINMSSVTRKYSGFPWGVILCVYLVLCE